MKKRALRALVALAAFLLPTIAFAAPQDTFNVTGTQANSMVGMIQDATQGWFATLLPLANGVFFALVGVEIFYFLVMTVLNRRDPDYFIPELLKKTMGIGFFLAILLNAGTWMSDLINGFQYAGSQAAGVGTLTPESIISLGASTAWDIVVSEVNLYQTMVASSWNPVTILTETVEYLVLFTLSLLIAAIFFIAFCMIAIELFVTLIETYIVIGASIIFVGLGGSRWTSSYVHKVIGYGVAVGTKLFFLYLIVGLIVAPGSGVVTQMQSQVTAMDAALAAGGSNFVNVCVAALGFYFYFVFVAFVLAIAAKRIPAFAASLLGGASSMSGGEVAGPALAAGAAVATGGAAMMLGGAAMARGGASALSSAVSNRGAGSVSAAATKTAPQVNPPAPSGGGASSSTPSGGSGGSGAATGKADQVSPPSSSSGSGGGGQATAAAKGPSASGSGSGSTTGKEQVSPPAASGGNGQTSQGTATKAASGGASTVPSGKATPATVGAPADKASAQAAPSSGETSASPKPAAGTPASPTPTDKPQGQVTPPISTGTTGGSGGTSQSKASASASPASPNPASGGTSQGTPSPTVPADKPQPQAQPTSQTPNTNMGTQGGGGGSKQVSPPTLDQTALDHAKKALDAIATHDSTTVSGGTPSGGGHLGSE